jgi:hypothetical protein
MLIEDKLPDIAADQTWPDAMLTGLLKKHFGEIKFDLRLKHKGTGMFVMKEGMTVHEAMALAFETGPAGETLEYIYAWFAEEAGASWLHDHDSGAFEVHSTLGEL